MHTTPHNAGRAGYRQATHLAFREAATKNDVGTGCPPPTPHQQIATHPRRTVAVLLTGLIACTSLSFLTPTPAVAEDKITHQDYMDIFGFDALRARGLTGKGIKIAVIDGPADTTVPELQGANIQQKYLCKYTALPEKVAHGTAVLSLLASRDYGWAPDATYINYPMPLGSEHVDCPDGVYPDFSGLINEAINDNVDVINVSLSSFLDLVEWKNEETSYPLLRAMRHKIPVVIAMGNESKQDPKSAFAKHNYAVGVSSTNLDGTLAEYSNYGIGTTVSAPGGHFSMRIPDENGHLTIIDKAHGTSFATPMVTGLLAVTMQQWPNATRDQILQHLVKTASQGHPWQPHYGWGLINTKDMISQDPTHHPDTNPLNHKSPTSLPNQETTSRYDDGFIDFGTIASNDTDYIYRGCQELYLLRWPDRTELCTSPRYDKNASNELAYR